jgi:iron complex outermembrane recepter protein
MVVMGSTTTTLGAITNNHHGRLPASTSISAAVLVGLYGLPPSAAAQEQPAATPGSLQEVIVTATRREQTAEEVPYSLSVISPEQIARANITDIASLALVVPGLSIYDFGARFAGATTPIIRGLNATSEPRGFRTFEQDPVGTYIGNSPVSGGGYFQLDDLERVEILRGPQGTLYGAGALGGALRFIPNAPKLGVFSGELGVGGSETAHSDGTGYILNALLNVPVADTFAMRLSAKYDYEPGFIDAYGLIRQAGPIPTGLPVLANPADPVNSEAVFYGQNDWNFQKTFTGRASALWKPSDRFTTYVAYEYGDVRGAGGPQVNPVFPGGPYALDPRVTFPAGGLYQEFTTEDQPFSRITTLLSVDLSYDAGFATVSSTSSYFTTKGSTINDDTYTFGAVPFIAYYAGFPTNPRYLDVQDFTDHAHTFSQEVRIVSAAAPDKPIDYAFGLYYEKQARYGEWNVSDPGSHERSVSQGCTAAYFSGATFPDCLTLVGAGDTVFNQADGQHFEDKSVFGELTWHFTAHGQITFGGRHFHEDFTDAQSYTDYAFPTFIPALPHSSTTSKNTWKVNPSYEYANHQYVYATWSQGFRRGGANSVPLTGFLRESPELATYAPDSVNNYEVGLKGRLNNGLTYTFALFDIEWDKPQISASLPSGNLAVYNGNTARSRGFEFESSGPLLLPGLTYAVSFAYAHAELTGNFDLPANDGAGNIVQGLVTGKAGEQLPGSPKVSAAATVSYQRSLLPGYDLSLSLNSDYRSHTPLGLTANTINLETSSFSILNFSASLTHKPWRVLGYVTNLTDKWAVLAPPVLPNRLGGLSNDYDINKPREVGLRLFYSFQSF